MKAIYVCLVLLCTSAVAAAGDYGYGYGYGFTPIYPSYFNTYGYNVYQPYGAWQSYGFQRPRHYPNLPQHQPTLRSYRYGNTPFHDHHQHSIHNWHQR